MELKKEIGFKVILDNEQFFNYSFCLSDYVRVMDMGLLELTITAIKPGSDQERVSLFFLFSFF